MIFTTTISIMQFYSGTPKYREPALHVIIYFIYLICQMSLSVQIGAGFVPQNKEVCFVFMIQSLLYVSVLVFQIRKNIIKLYYSLFQGCHSSSASLFRSESRPWHVWEPPATWKIRVYLCVPLMPLARPRPSGACATWK